MTIVHVCAIIVAPTLTFVKALHRLFTKRDRIMYEGENKTAQQSQQRIAEAMLELLREQPFSGLSVSVLCKKASVSRQTFYSLFGTREQVLVFALQTGCRYEPGPERTGCRSACFRDFCRGYSRYIVDHRETLELLARNDLMYTLYEMQYRSLLDCPHFMRELESDERQYLVDFIASGMTSIAKTFVRTGGIADTDTLERIMHRLFGGGFLASTCRPER